MRFLAIFLGIVFLVGCSAFCPQQKQPLFQDQIDYTKAIDHFLLTEEVDELLNFTEAYPNSPWTGRANIVIRYSHELKQLTSEIEKLRLSDVKHRTDLEKITTVNQQLTDKLEKFKGLLIQLEAQPQ